jgi:hypothetical protein
VNFTDGQIIGLQTFHLSAEVPAEAGMAVAVVELVDTSEHLAQPFIEVVDTMSEWAAAEALQLVEEEQVVVEETLVYLEILPMAEAVGVQLE